MAALVHGQLDAKFLHHRFVSNVKLSRLPSEYTRMVKISVDRELQGVKYRDQIGVDNLMFGTDYPPLGSFWPHTTALGSVAERRTR